MLSSVGVSGGTEDAEFEKRVQDRVASGESRAGSIPRNGLGFSGLVGSVRVWFLFRSVFICWICWRSQVAKLICLKIHYVNRYQGG